MSDVNEGASAPPQDPSGPSKQQMALFWGCFIALVATSVAFSVRAMVIDDWAAQFGLDETQKGEILGVGLWPFALSIILFSLIIDKIGYGRAMVFAFCCHVGYVLVTFCAPMVLAGPDASQQAVEQGQQMGYWMLYLGTFIVAIGNGTVEAAINPAVATMFPNQKTKWLNILHAGWPGGLVLGGVISIFLGDVTWQWKVGFILLPAVIYGVMLLGRQFPVHERVAAGVSYRDMLREVGVFGAIIAVGLMTMEVGRVFGWHWGVELAVGGVLVISFGSFIGWSLGRPLFILLLLAMIPLATTELGTDSWITELMGPAMGEIGINAGWVLVYTSAIMMVLRFYAGPIVHALSPLGLLAISALVACLGLIALSSVAGAVAILAAATLYGFGKSFLWPTSLGLVAEQSPKGGALTLNTLAGVGMIGVGIIGNPLLGNLQDQEVDGVLAERNPELHEKIVGDPQESVVGTYQAVDSSKVEALTPKVQEAQALRSEIVNNLAAELGEHPNAEQIDQALSESSEYQSIVSTDAYKEQKEIVDQLDTLRTDAKQNALASVAVLPAGILIFYLCLIFYFRSKGGYKAEELTGEPEPEEKHTGGQEAPAEP